MNREINIPPPLAPHRRHYRSISSPILSNLPVSQQDYASLPSSPATSFLAKFAMSNDEMHTPAISDLLANRYRIGEMIAPPSCYLVSSLDDGVELVTKILSSESDEAKQSFEHEVTIWEKLSHPHLMPLLEHAPHYAIMPYCREGNLKQWLSRRDTLDPECAMTLIKQLASAVSYLHSRDICHGDVKLDNIIMLNDEHLYLSDFGMSYCHCCSAQELLQLPDRIQLPRGTPGYLAPEQIEQAMQGQPCGPSQAADCWAMGVCLYAMLAGGKLPFSDEYTPRLVQSIKNLDYPSLGYEGTPVGDLLAALLTADPKHRATANQIY